MGHSFTNLVYHAVFSTKDRRSIIQPEVDPELYDYIGGTIRGLGGVSFGVNGMPDHVHLLIKLRPDTAVSDVLRDVKTAASKWMKQTVRDFAWQPGYGLFTVSQSQIETVQRYIANQAEHHRKESFQSEFEKLLRAHGIEFDEKYLWKS